MTPQEKLELLKKLTRLANNNPNENEANLAARRVCKMLIENDFTFLPQTKTAQAKVGINYEGSWTGFRPAQNQEERIKEELRKKDEQLRREAAERQRQASARAQTYTYYDESAPFTEEMLREMLKKMKEEQDRVRYKPDPITVSFDSRTNTYTFPDGTKMSAAEFHSQPRAYRVNDSDPFFRTTYRGVDWGTKEKQKPEQVERTLKCYKCGDENKTYFVGPPQMYICYQCQFREHNQRSTNE